MRSVEAEPSMIRGWMKKVFEAISRLLDKISLKLMNLTEREQMILKKMSKEQEEKNKSSVSFIIVGLYSASYSEQFGFKV